MESYLHQDAIKNAFDIDIEIPDFLNDERKGVPKIFAEAYSRKCGFPNTIRDAKSKQYLSERAFPEMTVDMIEQRDEIGEVKSWFEKINEMIK